tara:strand:+ start:1835 stop:2797 length:963 start_codon:yes stop_codon:yes gene_type:complete
MQILVTGSAGFIGSAITQKLLNEGFLVVGIDNLNDYYDPSLKEARLSKFIEHKNYTHLQSDISDRKLILDIFKKNKFSTVINLAAQAGVRYSLKNPEVYVNSNLLGFANILEGCRITNVDHLIYASSSSVYGANLSLPFKTTDNVDQPISFYAATKKSNELMAHSYSHLYGFKSTGLRFFTVYGPWDRPDMALQTFSRAIISGEKIKIYNNGNHIRDFTYIEDIVEGLQRVVSSKKNYKYKIYNIGNSNPVKLMDFINILEDSLGIVANKEYLPLQEGDMRDTYADITDLEKDFDYKPKMSIEEGISKFVSWYKIFYKIQ